MLKIKFNINEFTIIFLRRFERKRMLNRSRSASVQFSTPSSFLLLFFLFQCLFFFFSFFSFCFQRTPFVSFLPAFLFFSVHVCPFFQPKTILSSAQKHFFQLRTFLLQPKTFFSSAHATVSAFFFLFVGSVFNAPFLFVQRLLFFFLFQRLILFFLPTSKAKNILFRCFTFLLFE